MEKEIKDYREKELKSFVIGNILLILISSGLMDQIVKITDSSNAWTAINAVLASAVFSSVIYIFVFVADSIVPGSTKDKIIWFIGGKPGEHIFADIYEKHKDNRYTKEQAQRQYSDIYQKIKGKDRKDKETRNLQNATWYGIYKTHETHAQVIISQRDFLLCRDMCIMAPLILVGYLCLQWYRNQNLSWAMVGLPIVQFIVLWLTARSKGKRFAYNVIAVDIAKNKKEEKKSNLVVSSK